MNCCSAEKHNNWCQDLPLVTYRDKEGNGYCAFHAPPGKKDIGLEKFNVQVLARISDAHLKQTPCDLSGTLFEGNIVFSKITEKLEFPVVSFRGVTFPGKTDFSGAVFADNADFSGAVFLDKADFCVATFGEADFSGSTFSGGADFSFATFKGADFRVAAFSEKTTFRRAKFSEKAIFRRAMFSGEADFSRTMFLGKANFRRATFSERADFSFDSFREADFLSTAFREADFCVTTFSEQADFSRAIFTEKADFRMAELSKALFYGESFRGRAMFKNVLIRERIVFENAVLEQAEFLETDLMKCEFVNCRWLERGNRYIIYDEEILKDTEQEDEALRKVESLYRAQKETCRRKHNVSDYSLWHYSEKEMLRRRTGMKDPFHFVVLHLYWLFSGYCEEPKRALLWMFAFYIVAVVALGTVGLMEGGQEIALSSIGGLKKISLTTLEYLTFQNPGTYDVRPANNLGQVLKILLTALFYIQTALFAIALRNRFRR